MASPYDPRLQDLYNDGHNIRKFYIELLKNRLRTFSWEPVIA